jgi:hypothetical protein
LTPKNYYDNYLDSRLKDIDNIYYILIKLSKTRYISLGFILSEFNIPDDDKIINIDASHSKGGNQNIKLIGEKHSYFLDDCLCTPHSNIGCNCYVSNDNINKYRLGYFFCDEGKIEPQNQNMKPKPTIYIETIKSIPAKFLGIKYNKYKKEKVYNVINNLQTETIKWD